MATQILGRVLVIHLGVAAVANHVIHMEISKFCLRIAASYQAV